MTARTLGPLSIGANGVLVLAAADLPRWAHFGTVLARVETDGDESVTDGTRCVVRRARPVGLVEGWTDEAIRRWAYECIDRAVRLHAATALEAAGIIGHPDRLRGLPRTMNGATARAASEAAREAASPWDNQPDGPEEGTAAWFASYKAEAAASRFAADEDDEDEETDENDEEEEATDEDAEGSEDVADDYGMTARQAAAAAERAAKYAAEDARWAAGNAAEAVAERTATAAGAVFARGLSNIGYSAQQAEYLWQAARLAELVGIDL